MVIKLLLLNNEKDKYIANSIMSLDIRLIVVYVSEIWSKKQLMKED